MASIGEVGEGLDRVLDKAAEAGAALQVAAELAVEAQASLSAALGGSLQADVEATTSHFAAVVSGTQELYQVLGTSISCVEAILRRLDLGGDADPALARQPPQNASPPVDSFPSPDRGNLEHVGRLQGELPPPVQRGSGQKTHGRWFTPDGSAENAIISGEDELAELVAQRIRELGAARRPVTVDHVETKLAAHMAQQGITEATVVINNAVCKGPFGCDTLVPLLLPKGSSLTVYGVTAQGVMIRTRYTGGAESPWRS